MQASTQVVMKKAIFLAVILMAGILTAGIENAFAAPVAFQEGTATFHQIVAGVYSPDVSVNGNTSDSGWAIGSFTLSEIVSQTAVWETTTDVNAGQLDFKLHQNFGGKHLIGRFRLSVTSDDRSLFADGLDTGGDVTANWTELTSPVVSGSNGITLTAQGDNSILALASGTIPETSVYDVQFTGSFSGITGIRLEVLEHASLPNNGPGLTVGGGNFVLSEIELDATAVPEPSTLLLLGTGLMGLVGYSRRKRRA